MELGAYAMDLGDGYLIHGTLYQRALGLSITHGCVRLGDADLETVYRKVRVGTPVYIF
jgi:L,D-transpeptidase YbiS